MPKPKRLLDATAQLTTTPPDDLPSNHTVARVMSSSGKNLYIVALPSQRAILVELAPQFRNSIWLRKGGFVIVDTVALADRDNKLDGEIVNVVRDEKRWRKMSWWPKEFPKQSAFDDESDEDSIAGRMPPSDSEEEVE